MISCLKIPFDLRKRKRPMDCPERSREGGWPERGSSAGRLEGPSGLARRGVGGGCRQSRPTVLDSEGRPTNRVYTT